MRKIKLFLFAAILGVVVNAQEKKTQVLVLGTYHFDNPGLDTYNIAADDVLSDKRQKEIKEVVTLLSKFKPTKVAIERRWQTKYDTIAREKYQKYLKNEYVLQRPEDEQIGFRLAKTLGHLNIYPIDVPGNFPMEEMISYATKNGQEAIVSFLQETMAKHMPEEQKFVNTHTIKEIFKKDNSNESLDFGHGMYVKMLEIGKNNDYPGAKLLSDWYVRNLKIFSNLTRIAEKEDRIVLIFGAGHAPILRELIDDHPDYELIDVSEYLE